MSPFIPPCPDITCVYLPLGCHHPGKPEVTELDDPSSGDQDVLRLYITVDDLRRDTLVELETNEVKSCTMTEKCLLSSAFSLLKVAATAFTFKILLRNLYAKQEFSHSK